MTAPDDLRKRSGRVVQWYVQVRSCDAQTEDTAKVRNELSRVGPTDHTPLSIAAGGGTCRVPALIIWGWAWDGLE